MPEVGDIIEIPYEEGTCVTCGWTVNRDKPDEAWHGRLGGDCRIDYDGVHKVIAPMTKARRARVAEGWLTTFTLMNGDKVVATQQVPGGANYHERLPEPILVTEVLVSHYKYRYNAAVND